MEEGDSRKQTTPVEEEDLQKETKSVPLRGDDERLRPAEQFQVPIGEALLTITGAFKLDLDLQNNLNLRSTRERDRFRLTPEFNLDFILAFPQGFSLFTEFGLEDEVTFDKGDKPENKFKLELKEAFAEVPLPLPIPSLLRVGRQQLFEPRRWVFNNRQDAVQLSFDPYPFHLDLFAAARIPSSPDSLRFFDDIFEDRDQVDFVINSTYGFAPGSSIGQYVILGRKHQNRIERGNPRDEDPIWIGLRSLGKPKFKFGRSPFLRPKIWYWIDGAFVTGTVGTKDIRGFAVDVGGSYIFEKLQFKPYITLGYAFGSGDSNSTDTVDRNFRQTGFHSNSGKFGGVVSFDYYGVLFDPELSNLQVFTAGIGFRPIVKSSVDVVYHHYTQHTAVDE
ncbi:MAG: alginate export family protein, partial [Acidobacteriota bacterium]